jgi:hypothetical protein
MSTPSTNPSSWYVVSQAPSTEVVPTGGVERGWLISYRTGAGVNGSVFLSAAAAGDEDQVRAAIQSEVDAIMRRSQLSG